MKTEQDLVRRIAQLYGLDVLQIHPAQKGYRNRSFALALAQNNTANLILYKREPDILPKIKNANRVSNFLASQGLPARHTLHNQIIRASNNKTILYAGLYNYLPGSTIPWEGYTMGHIKLLGGMMSDLHAAVQALPQEDEPYIIDECRVLLARMEKYFADEGVHDAMAAKLELAILDITRLRPALNACMDLPGQHALHMDFVRGNILFDGQGEDLRISGVLDFEKTAWGPPIFDIARTLAFLIIDCKYKDEAKVRKYFLHSGYNKRGKSAFDPNPLLESLIDFFLLHDFYKFLRHNPYQSLEQNEHFVRTRDFLLRRNLLSGVVHLGAEGSS
jgi:Ser/Thr protein kinase RdoA (MazF antagonist)